MNFNPLTMPDNKQADTYFIVKQIEEILRLYAESVRGEFDVAENAVSDIMALHSAELESVRKEIVDQMAVWVIGNYYAIEDMSSEEVVEQFTKYPLTFLKSTK